jgi:hypothetical protein
MRCVGMRSVHLHLHLHAAAARECGLRGLAKSGWMQVAGRYACICVEVVEWVGMHVCV